MGKRTPGLRKRGEIWHIQKIICGLPVAESTGTSNLQEAERYLAHRIAQLRQHVLYGVRARRLWREAAARYLEENTHKRRLRDDAITLRQLDSWIGDLPLDRIHMGTLQPWMDHRRQSGIKSRSVNHALALVRRILNLAARLWRDDNGQTWLEVAPMMPALPVLDASTPYPLSQEEWLRLANALPEDLRAMATFALHTGCREQEVCGLRWEWETRLPDLQTSVFILPGQHTKNGQERVVVLNETARRLVEERRQQGGQSGYVFERHGQRVPRLNTRQWQRAWQSAGLPIDGYTHGPHNLRHTCGRWLRAAGVPLETRKAILGHKSGDITTHYSQAEIAELLTAVRRLDVQAVGVLLRVVGQNPGNRSGMGDKSIKTQ